MNNFCDCKPCRKQRRKGKVLGSRVTYSGGSSGQFYVSDYVAHPKFAAGRRPDPAFNPNSPLEI